MNYPVYFQGKILPKSELNFSFLSPSFQYGLTPFDTIACIKKSSKIVLFRPLDHIVRLKKSCAGLDIIIKESSNDILECLNEYLKIIKPSSSVIVRVMAFAEEGSWSSKTLEANLVFSAYTAHNYDLDTSTSTLSLSTSHYGVRPEKLTHDFSIKVGANYLNARYATIDAVKRGFDATLLLDTYSNISELGGANIFFLRDKSLFTPKLSSNILDGITRQSIIRYCKELLCLEVNERDISIHELSNYDFAFACGTTLLLKGISSINDVDYRVLPRDQGFNLWLMSSISSLLTASIEFQSTWLYTV